MTPRARIYLAPLSERLTESQRNHNIDASMEKKILRSGNAVGTDVHMLRTVIDCAPRRRTIRHQ